MLGDPLRRLLGTLLESFLAFSCALGPIGGTLGLSHLFLTLPLLDLELKLIAFVLFLGQRLAERKVVSFLQAPGLVDALGLDFIEDRFELLLAVSALPKGLEGTLGEWVARHPIERSPTPTLIREEQIVRDLIDLARAAGAQVAHNLLL